MIIGFNFIQINCTNNDLNLNDTSLKSIIDYSELPIELKIEQITNIINTIEQKSIYQKKNKK